MRWEVALKGGGRAELAAYGIADAEHQVEKEILGLCPEARVDVLEVARTAPGPRIVEEFAVRYRLRATVSIDAETEADARRAARRTVNERLAGTRYARIAWDAE
ncbi:MAG TPA: hypothetical protein VLK66_23325 [Longimicrobium sp.]|nr:hypothetical protein [Longimicrobium sp.]